MSAIVLALALAAAPASRAGDAFDAAHDDSGYVVPGRPAGNLVYALAPDASDESGLSARAFDPGGGSAAPVAQALAANPHDDAGVGTFTRGEAANEEAASGDNAQNTVKLACSCTP